MQYLHVKNLEKYHPGYKDRDLQWCKIYFKMLGADPAFELLGEIDKWRFVAFIMLELQIKDVIPLDPTYLSRKGFDLKKRSITRTIQMLHNFVEYVTEDQKLCNLDALMLDKEQEGAPVTPQNGLAHFVELWNTLCPSLQTVQALSRERQHKIRRRLRDRSLEAWGHVFRKIEASAFCRGERGRHGRQWRATFDWIISNEANAIKVLEGNYDDHDAPESKPGVSL